MIRLGDSVQLNNDYHIALSEGSLTVNAGAVGEVETPGDRWARVRFTKDISLLVPTRLLNIVLPRDSR